MSRSYLRDKFNVGIFTVGGIALTDRTTMTVRIKSCAVAIFINDVWFYRFVNNGFKLAHANDVHVL